MAKSLAHIGRGKIRRNIRTCTRFARYRGPDEHRLDPFAQSTSDFAARVRSSKTPSHVRDHRFADVRADAYLVVMDFAVRSVVLT